MTPPLGGRTPLQIRKPSAIPDTCLGLRAPADNRIDFDHVAVAEALPGSVMTTSM